MTSCSRNAYTNMKHDLEEYQKTAQQQQQQPGQQKSEKQQSLTCSEHSVFGKFDSFCCRLLKINRLYDILDKHDVLFKGRLQGLLQDEESKKFVKI